MSYDSGVRGVGILSADILNDIVNAASAAHDKHGDQSALYGTDDKAMRILAEEVGEVAHAMNEYALGNTRMREYYKELRAELIQVASVASTWVAKIDAEYRN